MYRLRNILFLTNNEELECFDTESGDSIMSVGLYIQGIRLFVAYFSCINHIRLVNVAQ